VSESGFTSKQRKKVIYGRVKHEKGEIKILFTPRQQIHISSSVAHFIYTCISTQVSNAFVTQNHNSTKLNTLCRCQTRPFKTLHSICIQNSYGPNFDQIYGKYTLK